MDTLTFYKRILSSLHTLPDEKGLLTYHYADARPQPVVIDGKRLTLPTPERLRSGDWAGCVAFHPLSESVVRTDSPVLRKLRNLVQVRMTTVFNELLHQLVVLAANKEAQKKLAPHAAELLSFVTDADDKTIANIHSVLEAVEMEGPNRLLSIVLRRGGRFKDAKRSAVSLVSLPILDQFDSPDSKLFGVKLRKKDFIALRGLLDYILPDGADVETYSGVSDSMVAPGFDALLQAYANLGKAFNRVINIQRKQLKNEKELMTELDWLEFADDLNRYRGEILPLEGNVGGDEKNPALAAVEAPAAPSDVPWKEDDKPSQRKGSVYNTDIRREDYMAPAAGIRPGGGIAVGGIQPGGVAASRPVATSEVSRTKGGLDFRSLMAHRQQNFQQGTMATAQYGQPSMMVQPAWMQQPINPVPQVPPGSYANDPRYVPRQPQYGYAYNTAAPPVAGMQYNPVAPAGYGYNQPVTNAVGF